jgi:hypothetical protein
MCGGTCVSYKPEMNGIDFSSGFFTASEFRDTCLTFGPIKLLESNFWSAQDVVATYC